MLTRSAKACHPNLYPLYGSRGAGKEILSSITPEEVNVIGGMDSVRLKLPPGERIRSPRMLRMSWQGDRIDAHNRWRRLLLEYYSPRPGGKPFEGILAQAVWGNWMSADGHITEMDWWKENNLPLECYWIDAGWTDMSKGWVAHQSDRVPCKTLFPNGMRLISDAAHQRGLKFLLWLVPNSVHPEVEIGKQHPEWLGEPFSDKEFGNQVFYGLDHGNPAVNNFMIDYFSKLISDYGIDCQANGDFDPVSSQAFTFGLSFWLPLHGAAIPLAKRLGTYAMRSGYAPSMVMTWPGKPAEYRQDMDVNLFRKLMHEYLNVRKYFLGDYYPLTNYSLDPKADYQITDLDTQISHKSPGRELAHPGLQITLPAKPAAALLTYKILK